MNRKILSASVVGAMALLLAGFGSQADAGLFSKGDCCHKKTHCRKTRRHRRHKCCAPVKKAKCCAPVKKTKCCAPVKKSKCCKTVKTKCCKTVRTKKCCAPKPACGSAPTPAGKSYDGKAKVKKPAVKNAPAPPPEEKAPTPKKKKASKKKSA